MQASEVSRPNWSHSDIFGTFDQDRIGRTHLNALDASGPAPRNDPFASGGIYSSTHPTRYARATLQPQATHHADRVGRFTHPPDRTYTSPES